MKHFLFIICATLFACQTLKAQNTYTEKLRQNEVGKGTVIINHSAEIDRIVNGIHQSVNKSKTSNNTASKAQTQTQTEAKSTTIHPSTITNIVANKNEKAKHENKSKNEVKGENKHNTKQGDAKPNQAKHETNNPTTSAYISRARHKARGYRICIFTGGNSRADKIKAIQMGNKCRRKFGELAAYTSFEPPRWVTHVGDFKTRQEAQKYVVRIRRAHISYEVRIVASEVNIPY